MHTRTLENTYREDGKHTMPPLVLFTCHSHRNMAFESDAEIHWLHLQIQTAMSPLVIFAIFMAIN